MLGKGPQVQAAVCPLILSWEDASRKGEKCAFEEINRSKSLFMGQQGSERRQDAWREASGPGMGCAGFGEPKGNRAWRPVCPAQMQHDLTNKAAGFLNLCWWNPGVQHKENLTLYLDPLPQTNLSGGKKQPMIFSFSKYFFSFWSGGKCSDSIVLFKKPNEPFFLLVRKQEDAQCKWKWHMLKHFIIKWTFGAIFSHFHCPFLFWENKQAHLIKKTRLERKCRDLILFSLTFIWRKQELKGYVCAGK